MTMGWSSTPTMNYAPEACSNFKYTGTKYSRNSSTWESEFILLRAGGGSVEVGSASGDDGSWDCNTDANPDGCDMKFLEAAVDYTNAGGNSASGGTANPYRSTNDLFQLVDPTASGGFPLIKDLRFHCLKTDTSDASGRAQTMDAQRLTIESWIIYGVPTETRAGGEGGCDADSILDCDSNCSPLAAIGDGVCDTTDVAGYNYNCERFLYDEMDCLNQCEESTRGGTTCFTLVNDLNVPCDTAMVDGYDCSCTCEQAPDDAVENYVPR